MTDVRRLIATDVDGTLLTRDKRLSSLTVEAFAHVASTANTAIALVSSRMPASLSSVERELGVPCWKICYDGAILQGPGASDFRKECSRPLAVDDILAALDDEDIAYAGLYSERGWVCNAASAWSRREAFNTGVTPQASELPLSAIVRSPGIGPVFKVMFRDEEAVIARVKARLDALDLGSARWFSNGPTIVEIVPKDASKGAALQRLVEHLNITPADVTVFGDGANDIAMFERFSNSVAVGNAILDLKRIARHVVKRGDEDGVAAFLLQIDAAD